MPGIKAFTAAVLGGIGSIPGAALGGILLGYHRDISREAYISTQARRRQWCSPVLIVVLLVQPEPACLASPCTREGLTAQPHSGPYAKRKAWSYSDMQLKPQHAEEPSSPMLIVVAAFMRR